MLPHYCMALFPVQGMMDAKLMTSGTTFKANTPEELFRIIPAVPPLDGKFLKEIQNDWGSWDGQAVRRPLPL